MKCNASNNYPLFTAFVNKYECVYMCVRVCVSVGVSFCLFKLTTNVCCCCCCCCVHNRKHFMHFYCQRAICNLFLQFNTRYGGVQEKRGRRSDKSACYAFNNKVHNKWKLKTSPTFPPLRTPLHCSRCCCWRYIQIHI